MADTTVWKTINDFLLDAGSARDGEEFDRIVLDRLTELIPVDYPAALLRTDGETDLPVALIGEASLLADFNGYFRFHMPLTDGYFESHRFVDHREFAGSVFYEQYLRPRGIRYVMGSRRGYLPNLIRSGSSSPFSEIECGLFHGVAPHLNNLDRYHRAIARLTREAVSGAELAFDCRILSRREAEVVRLMALRMTAREIGSILRISPRTVERHIANSYDKLGVNDRASLLARVYGTGSGIPRP